MPERPQDDAPDAPPPILGTWRNIYLFVLAMLALWILAFMIFTWAYHEPS